MTDAQGQFRRTGAATGIFDRLRRAALQGSSAYRPDGAPAPKTVIYRGQEHTCELTKAEMAFLNRAVVEEEIAVDELMHVKGGLLFKVRYSATKAQRNRISQFLSRLNDKLANAVPPVPVEFTFRRGLDHVLRRDLPLR